MQFQKQLSSDLKEASDTNIFKSISTQTLVPTFKTGVNLMQQSQNKKEHEIILNFASILTFICVLYLC